MHHIQHHSYVRVPAAKGQHGSEVVKSMTTTADLYVAAVGTLDTFNNAQQPSLPSQQQQGEIRTPTHNRTDKHADA